MITDADIVKLKSIFATKEDLKGFAAKKDLNRFATKDDLRRFATKEDLKRFATKDDLRRFATKKEVHILLRKELKKYATREEIKQWFDEAFEFMSEGFKRMDDAIAQLKTHDEIIGNHERRLDRLEDSTLS